MVEFLQRTLDAAKSVWKQETGDPFVGGGPATVGPSLDTAPPPNAAPGQEPVLADPMSEEELSAWKRRIAASNLLIQQASTRWTSLLEAYRPMVVPTGASQSPDDLKSMLHFRNLHSKLGYMFYRSPDLVLTPFSPGPADNAMPPPQMPLMPGQPPPPMIPITMEDVISTKQEVLQRTLGKDGIKADRLIDELLFDVLGWAGIGVYKVGYNCWHRMVPTPVMAPAPYNPLQTNPQAQVPTGEVQMVPVPIHSEYYARRVSPKKLVIDVALHSTRVQEDATFIGMHFQMRKADAVKKFKLLASELQAAGLEDAKSYFAHTEYAGVNEVDDMVTGVELWVKAMYYKEGEDHPLKVRQLILLDQLPDRPAVWRDSPDQTFGPDGKLTGDSLEGFPMGYMSIRDLADSALPDADAAFTNAAVRQLTTLDKQEIKLRDAQIGKYIVDRMAFDEDQCKILEMGEAGSTVFVNEGALQQGVDKLIATTPQVKGTVDNARLRQTLSRQIDETLGISANAAGASEDTVRSATETATIDKAVRGRNAKERNRVVDCYLDIARQIDQLRMKYTSDQEYVQLVGEDGARRMMIWHGKIGAAKYFYDIAPDSQLGQDSAEDLDRDLRTYNQFAKDPLFNRKYWIRRVMRKLGADPYKAVLTDEQLFQQQMAQQAAGVADPTLEPNNKHEAERSGEIPNTPGAGEHREKPGV